MNCSHNVFLTWHDSTVCVKSIHELKMVYLWYFDQQTNVTDLLFIQLHFLIMCVPNPYPTWILSRSCSGTGAVTKWSAVKTVSLLQRADWSVCWVTLHKAIHKGNDGSWRKYILIVDGDEKSSTSNNNTTKQQFALVVMLELQSLSKVIIDWCNFDWLASVACVYHSHDESYWSIEHKESFKKHDITRINSICVYVNWHHRLNHVYLAISDPCLSLIYGCTDENHFTVTLKKTSRWVLELYGTSCVFMPHVGDSQWEEAWCFLLVHPSVCPPFCPFHPPERDTLRTPVGSSIPVFPVCMPKFPWARCWTPNCC